MLDMLVEIDSGFEEAAMGLADLHIHSNYSWDGIVPVASILANVAKTAELQVLAITDHNRIEGALEAVSLAPDYGLEVVPGCEVSTADGHLLALFVTQVIPTGLSLIETILYVGSLGGLCVAPHPMAGRVSDSLSEAVITRALQNPRVREIFVGMESYNAGNVGWLYSDGNPRARRLARRLRLAELGASDAHMLPAIGSGMTFFPGKTAQELRQALVQRQTQAVQGKTPGTVQWLGHWMVGVFAHATGWTGLAHLFGLL
jgi:predicted metal-dependent phosphoesterase TrpH